MKLHSSAREKKHAFTVSCSQEMRTHRDGRKQRMGFGLRTGSGEMADGRSDRIGYYPVDDGPLQGGQAVVLSC